MAKMQTIAVMRHSGTHLIKPLVKVMTGRGSAGGKGEGALNLEVQGKLVVFNRDPRNRLISAYRWKQTERLVTPGALFEYHDDKLSEMLTRRKKNGGMTVMEFMHAWADRWQSEPNAFIASFEWLISEELGLMHATTLGEFLMGPGEETERAAEFAYNEVVGKVTYTGRHSNWREWFGKKTCKAWMNNGGVELLRKMGYKE